MMGTPYRADILEKDAAAKQRHQAKIWAIVVFMSVALSLGALMIYDHFLGDIPKIHNKEEVWTANRPKSLEVVDKDGNTIAIRGPRYGRRTSVDVIPSHVLKAFLAVEDARFFEHEGVDLWAVFRAIWENIVAGHTVQGASTITQQLVKNVYLGPEQTLKRKIQELVLAWQIDRKFTKKEILEIYLNRIYFGQNSYGIGAAAWHYYQKRPQDLTLGQAAMLAGLPKAPGRLAINLASRPAIERRNVVLYRMVTAGFISEELARATAAEPVIVNIATNPPEGELAYAIDMASKEIDAISPAISPDRIARLTIDLRLQQIAVETIQNAIERAGPNSGVTQGALIAIDKRGRILAIVGGRTYSESQFNRAIQAKRQPGSTFKPIVYATALESGMTPNTVRVDKPVNFSGWRPHNFGSRYAGAVTLSTALTRSINTVAAQLASEVGIDKLISTAHRLGIESPLSRNLAISLGAGEVTLMDMTRTYATFANDGVKVDPFLIERVDTTRGTIAFERRTRVPTQVYDPARARQMTAMLSDVIAFGTGQRAQLQDGREAAGKTGTSSNFRDAWFIGYTADIICGVWIGNDEFKPMAGVSGGTLPAHIWASFMNKAHEGMPNSPLPTMDDLNQPDIANLIRFYQSLSEFFASAGGAQLSPLGVNQRLAKSQTPPTAAPATPENEKPNSQPAKNQIPSWKTK
ncbi:MAG: penicillin-binding protein [Hyphomonadaceae bacterium]|nr:MAG: penicillin-binding protein [Hyphomonadaceae bacterium]